MPIIEEEPDDNVSNALVLKTRDQKTGTWANVVGSYFQGSGSSQGSNSQTSESSQDSGSSQNSKNSLLSEGSVLSDSDRSSVMSKGSILSDEDLDELHLLKQAEKLSKLRRNHTVRTAALEVSNKRKSDQQKKVESKKPLFSTFSKVRIFFLVLSALLIIICALILAFSQKQTDKTNALYVMLVSIAVFLIAGPVISLVKWRLSNRVSK